jgi:chromosome partitioning protein
VNALVAADALLGPVTPQHLAVDALDGLLTSIARARSRLAMRSLFMGLLLVMIGNGQASTAGRVADLRSRFRDRLFATRIPSSAAFEDAAVAGRPIFDVAPKSAAATAFHRLAREVLDRGRAIR